MICASCILLLDLDAEGSRSTKRDELSRLRLRPWREKACLIFTKESSWHLANIQTGSL
jgi:hypothetical protein